MVGAMLYAEKEGPTGPRDGFLSRIAATQRASLRKVMPPHSEVRDSRCLLGYTLGKVLTIHHEPRKTLRIPCAQELRFT